MIEAESAEPIQEGVLSLVGNTPMIRLTRLFDDDSFELFAKMENLNPGGSVKDRPALNLLRDALQRKLIDTDTTIIESTSGNLGIGLAQACGYLGIKLTCVVDCNVTQTNIRMLQLHGAKVDVVSEMDPEAKTLLAARIKRVDALLKSTPNSFQFNQFENPLNPAAHRQTVEELMQAMDHDVDYLFLAVSTCGTLRGCSEYIRDNALKTKVVAVDAVGSVIFGTPPQPRMLPGHGAGISPPHYEPGLEHQHIHISDRDCVIGCRRLLARESIFAGASTGGVVYAIDAMRESFAPGSRVAMLVADRGGRYLDTVYDDNWVNEYFGDLSMHWTEPSPKASGAGLPDRGESGE